MRQDELYKVKYFKEGFGRVEEIDIKDIKINIPGTIPCFDWSGDIFSIFRDKKLDRAIIRSFPNGQEGANFTYINYNENMEVRYKNVYVIERCYEFVDEDKNYYEIVGYELEEN